MMTSKVKRRLTTILCADVQGYARLMQADEAGTLANLRRCREAMGALVDRHDGRIVNTWGDAVIAEFASVVEAVQCAVEIQQELTAQNGDRSEEQRMRYRIGINLGDVMVDGGDIYGDGVNIAARLQELAEPGGILISAPVYDQVHNKLPVGFDCVGEQQVKNVAGPVVSYRVRMGGGTSGPVPSRRHLGVRPRRIARCPEAEGRCRGIGLVQGSAADERGARRLVDFPVPGQRVHRPGPDLVPLARHADAPHRRHARDRPPSATGRDAVGWGMRASGALCGLRSLRSSLRSAGG